MSDAWQGPLGDDERIYPLPARVGDVPPCPAQTGPVWKEDGEACGCTRPAGHDGDHTCSCGAWFVDGVRRDRGVR